MDFKYLNENANQNCLMRSVYRLIIIQDTWAMGYGLWAMHCSMRESSIHVRTYSVRAKGQNERFELLTAVLLKTQVCWHVTPCH